MDSFSDASVNLSNFLGSVQHWQTECKLMEVNIRDGAFSEAVNKLDCAGVIINVPSEKYYRYISEWQLYKAKNK